MSSRDSVSRTAVQASNLLTLVSGFSFSSSANNRFIVSANIVAYVLQITTSSALTAGTTCQIGTLASSVASTPQLCILDQSGTVVLNGTSMSFISGSNRAAGTTFWLRGFYMLA